MKALLFSCVFAAWLFPIVAFGEDPLSLYYGTINASCILDADCALRNVGNCCGSFYRCVNVQEAPDPARAKEICRTNQIVSICEHSSARQSGTCKCADGKCVKEPELLNGLPVLDE